MKCQACQQETLLPFRCPFAVDNSAVHTVYPKTMQCPKIDAARAQTQERVMTHQSYNSYNYSYVFGQDPYKRKNHITSSQKEVKHIGIAAALVIGIGFSMACVLVSVWSWTCMMAVFAVVMTVSFLVHEIAHKVMAQKAGMWAEFRLTTWGAVLTFVSVFLPFKMIAPGAMMIGGQSPSAKDMVKISVAGVITNMIFAGTFLGLAFGLPISGYYWGCCSFAAYINAFMAVFNLIPFGVLDGYKIFQS